MLLTERHGTARNGTERHELKFVCLEWLESESSFIFWMVILNLTATSIDLVYANNLIRTLIIIFAVDVTIISFFAVVLDLMLYILLHKFKLIHNLAKIFILAVNIFVFMSDLFALYYFQVPFNSIMLDVALMTNIREGSEFLQMYLADKNFWLYILCSALSVFILYKLFKLIFRRRVLFCALLLIFVAYGAFASVREVVFRKSIRSGHMFNYANLTRLGCMLSQSYEGREAYFKVLKEAPQNPVITENESSIPYVIFILGESTDRNRMQLYGYNLPNTPNFMRRSKFYVFDDIVSPHSHTVAVMRKMFTFYRYGSNGEWFNYMNLFSILNASGYHTVWLSNQENNINTNAMYFFAHLCSVTQFIEPKEYWDVTKICDEKLLPILDKELMNSHEKNFYLLHLLGTHGGYKKRYTQDYEKFSAEDETAGFEGLNDGQKQTRAEYDNAVLYNDYVVNEIIKRFDDKNAIIIYISDHGEDVFDSSNILLGHNEGTPSRFMIEVPMIIWLSEKFAASYPELEARIASSIHKPYMTDDMIHTVLDIMQIETPEYDPAKSIINASFDVTRPRIYSGHIYDKEKGLIKIAVQ